MHTCMILQACMHTVNAINVKRINNRINSFDLLSNGIKKIGLKRACNSQRNTRESRTSSHIKHIGSR